jgi:hypothetical protein
MAKRQKNRPHNGQKTEEQTTQWSKEEGQTTQWPKEGQTAQNKDMHSLCVSSAINCLGSIIL